MKSYLYAVQDDTGREVCSAEIAVDKVGDVTAEFHDDVVGLRHLDDYLVEGGPVVEGRTYTLHRWPADDKLARPVSHPVR